MLERAGDTDTRPDGLEVGSGLVDGVTASRPCRRRPYLTCGCIA